ncbi:type I-E CRISPR-associated protein Cse2/CasB [Methanoregula sp.]|uniref:type I-E CRISPR-associated protein Cse2/CasB n=1 Tax=Methanoregula sp. TaxID=2052170 RepID=UPI00356B3E0C
MEQKHYLTFTQPETREILITWWKALDTSRGDRAELRRCHSPLNVAFTPAYHRLRIAMMKQGSVKDEDLALVAGVLSHVKSYTSGSFPIQMAGTDSADAKKAKINSHRFRRLLAIDDQDKLYETIIRVVRMLGGAVDIPSLANGIYWWNERTKKEWAFAYYEHAPSEEK